MAFPPIDKTFKGMMSNYDTRLTLVERRLARGSDGGGGTGSYLADWDTATSDGFYWGTNATLNGPTLAWDNTTPTLWSGVVRTSVGTNGLTRIHQELRESRSGQERVSYVRYFNGSTWTAWSNTPSMRVTNWDDIKFPGFYWGNNATGQPPVPIGTQITYWIGTVDVMYANDGSIRVQQTLERPDTPNNPRWQRSFNIGGNGIWSSWVSEFEGMNTTDWDTAMIPGPYYSENTAVNGPVADRLIGRTSMINTGSLAGRLIQEVSVPAASSTVLRSWRRVWNLTSWTSWYPMTWNPTNYFVYRSSAQTIPASTWTTISWNATLLNEGGIGFSGGVWTIPQNGTYLINAAIHYVALASASSGQRILAMLHNTTRIEGVAGVNFPTNVSAGATFTIVRNCVAGDTIAIQAYQSQGADQNCIGGDAYTWAQITLQNARP